MASETSPVTVLHQIATSLVARERYQTVEEALWELAISSIKKKISYYQRRIRNLEKKHGMTLEQFTQYLKNRANPDEEDDWFAWQAAQDMLNDWKLAYQDLSHERPY